MDITPLQSFVKFAAESQNPALSGLGQSIQNAELNPQNTESNDDSQVKDEGTDSSVKDDEASFLEPAFEEVTEQTDAEKYRELNNHKLASLWEDLVAKSAGDAKRKFSCILVRVPKDIKLAIEQFQKTIPIEDLYTEEEGHGLEDDPHVTVLYGTHTNNGEDIKGVVSTNFKKPEISISLGKTSIFDNPKFDVLKLDVTSEDLSELNGLLRKNLPYTSDYDEYHAHCTIAYLKKGKASQFADKEVISESFTTDKYIFSNSDSDKQEYSLGIEKKSSLWDDLKKNAADKKQNLALYGGLGLAGAGAGLGLTGRYALDANSRQLMDQFQDASKNWSSGNIAPTDVADGYEQLGSKIMADGKVFGVKPLDVLKPIRKGFTGLPSLEDIVKKPLLNRFKDTITNSSVGKGYHGLKDTMNWVEAGPHEAGSQMHYSEFAKGPLSALNQLNYETADGNGYIGGNITKADTAYDSLRNLSNLPVDKGYIKKILDKVDRGQWANHEPIAKNVADVVRSGSNWNEASQGDIHDKVRQAISDYTYSQGAGGSVNGISSEQQAKLFPGLNSWLEKNRPDVASYKKHMDFRNGVEHIGAAQHYASTAHVLENLQDFGRKYALPIGGTGAAMLAYYLYNKNKQKQPVTNQQKAV